MTPLSGSTDDRDILRTSEAIVLVLPGASEGGPTGKKHHGRL